MSKENSKLRVSALHPAAQAGLRGAKNCVGEM